MLCFFSLSYREWASTHDVALGGDPELGLWLKDTQLFKEAWGTAVATPARFWWTQQIFFFTAVWSVFLGQEGKRLRPRPFSSVTGGLGVDLLEQDTAEASRTYGHSCY